VDRQRHAALGVIQPRQSIKSHEISLDDLMDDYFAGKPPFGKGDKKAEFPDAITVKVLADWAKSEGAQILVVSGDKGVCEARGPVESLIQERHHSGDADANHSHPSSGAGSQWDRGTVRTNDQDRVSRLVADTQHATS